MRSCVLGVLELVCDGVSVHNWQPKTKISRTQRNMRFIRLLARCFDLRVNDMYKNKKNYLYI